MPTPTDLHYFFKSTYLSFFKYMLPGLFNAQRSYGNKFYRFFLSLTVKSGEKLLKYCASLISQTW